MKNDNKIKKNPLAKTFFSFYDIDICLYIYLFSFKP